MLVGYRSRVASCITLAVVLAVGLPGVGRGAAVDNDGDGYCADQNVNPGSPVCPLGGSDCDDNDALVNPGAEERCNGRDDNCNGKVDEGDPELGWGGGCFVPGKLGICRLGELRCVDVNGAFRVQCEQTTPAEPEVRTGRCNNGRDDDCDGSLDRADPDCGGEPQPPERPSEICYNCADDDGDGLADLADPDCRSDFLVITRARLRTRHGRTTAKLAATTGPAPFSEPPAGGFRIAVATPSDFLTCTRIPGDSFKRRGRSGRKWRAKTEKGAVRLSLTFEKDATMSLVLTLGSLAEPEAGAKELTLSVHGGGAAYHGPVPLRQIRRGTLAFP